LGQISGEFVPKIVDCDGPEGEKIFFGARRKKGAGRVGTGKTTKTVGDKSPQCIGEKKEKREVKGGDDGEKKTEVHLVSCGKKERRAGGTGGFFPI